MGLLIPLSLFRALILGALHAPFAFSHTLLFFSLLHSLSFSTLTHYIPSLPPSHYLICPLQAEAELHTSSPATVQLSTAGLHEPGHDARALEALLGQ